MEFSKCTLGYLEKNFGLVQKWDCRHLQEWLDMPMEITPKEETELADLKYLLKMNILHWNEQELALHFIGPIFNFARLTSVKYNLFAERFIAATVNGIELSGRPDGLLASGYREPEVPYFCFQEYKKERDPEGDPAAQCLAAMLVGQTLNNNTNKSMYGAYVIGRDWYFMTLNEKEYCISQDFSAVTNDISTILKALKSLKQIIEKRIS